MPFNDVPRQMPSQVKRGLLARFRTQADIPLSEARLEGRWNDLRWWRHEEAPARSLWRDRPASALQWPQPHRSWRQSWLAGALAAVFAVVAPVGAQQSTAPAAALVFDNVTVIDVEQGKLVAGQRVVIVGSRIQAVGDRQAVPIPAGSQVVMAQGQYLIPGLWDMHTHPTMMNPEIDLLGADLIYPFMLAYGVTGMRDAGSELSLDTLMQWRRAILAGTQVGPPRQLLSGVHINDRNNSACGNAMPGMMVLISGGRCSETPEETVRLVDSLAAAGADIIKTYWLGPSMYFALAAEARRKHIPFGGHSSLVGAITASDSGASILDHINTAGGLDTLCLAQSATVGMCRPVAERLRRNGTWFVPTFAVAIHERYEGAGIGENSKAIFRRYTERLSQFWADTSAASLALFRTPPPPAPMPDSVGVMALAQQLGVPILAGTDGMGGPKVNFQKLPLGITLHTELEMFVAEGMTPLSALQSATLNPVKMFHGTDSLGTVAAGKLADLVLLDTNPLENITNTRTIRAVVANGRYFDRAALDQIIMKTRAKIKALPR